MWVVYCKTSLNTKVHGFPKRLSSYAGEPLSLSPTEIWAEEWPVKLPMNPAQAILAKGTEALSVGWYTATTGHLEIGACSSQSSALKWSTFPVAVALPQAPRIEQEALSNSGTKLIYLNVQMSTPDPSAKPLNSSFQCLSIYGAQI